jgi:glycosyltransferase involved in cell wall biosynthesis
MQKTITKRIEIDVYGNVVEENYFKTCREIFPFNYKGTVARNELLLLLQHYDFLVLPSVFTEMYPMVIQEAFDIGIPVIASAAKGNVDLIREGKNGFIFQYNNHKDLANVIDNAYQLKRSGWTPEFEVVNDADGRIHEVLSYYKI